MYDIKIFIEDNWQFWARVNAWKEIIYWVWENQEELMNNLKKSLESSFENKEKIEIQQDYFLILMMIKKLYAIKI